MSGVFNVEKSIILQKVDPLRVFGVTFRKKMYNDKGMFVNIAYCVGVFLTSLSFALEMSGSCFTLRSSFFP